MTIFQKSVIKRHLDNLDKEQVEKAYQKFRENYSPAKIEEIKKLKEEEYQDGFLRDIFVDVFEYILKPDSNYNLAREFKNHGDGKKADGAILKNEKAVAIIELKSTKTKDLKSITEQAFNYKNNQPECKYVITSNFQKLRFYIDYAHEYEEFDLFNLQKEDFELLYLLLSANSIFSDLPLKLKEETKFHEQQVSDKLYKDYSIFKRKLFENLIKHNPDNDKLTLFNKSQKLLDRFLFILFAEDSGLLPPNSISRIIDTFHKLTELDAYKPIYDIYKQYFGYMNIGRKGKTNADNIPAYNGGLFYTDEILDNLKIDDSILIDDLLKLSEYDFNTEVDVNILGHIFEHSLSEIEEITAEIEGTTTDKTKSKRKKDGVFYTPKYITQYIVENTIGTVCNEKRKELEIEEIEFDGSYRAKDGKLLTKGKKLYQKLNDYKEWLLSLKIVDPACGSGAFLNQALNFLIKEHKNIDDIIAELTNTALRLFDTDKAILENNLYGVDINEESVEIAKLSLWLRTAQMGRKLSSLNDNIKCGNSLIDDPEIARDKAFDWNVEFKEIMDNGGFDVVIGNPPYVRNETILNTDKNYFEKNYSVFTGKSDLYVFFFEKSWQLLKHDGKSSFIVSSKFTKTKYGKVLIDFLNEHTHIISFIDFQDSDVFKGIIAYPSIIFFNKTKVIPNKAQSELLVVTNENYNKFESKSQNFFKTEQSSLFQRLGSWVNGGDNEKLFELFKLLETKFPRLSDIIKKPQVGIKTGANSSYIFLKKEVPIIIKGSPLLKPYVIGREVKRYATIAPQHLVILPYLNTDEGLKLITNDNKYSNEFKYLELRREALSKRAIIDKGIINGSKSWYEFQQIKIDFPFTSEYIIYPDISSNVNFTLAKNLLMDMTCFGIPSNSKSLLGILNSKLIKNYLDSICVKARGGYLRLKSQYILQIPIPDNFNKIELNELVTGMIQIQSKTQSLLNKFTSYLQSQFQLEKLPIKIQNWHKLEFREFIKELNKAIKKVDSQKLSKLDEIEWMEVFETKKDEIQTLKAEIDKTDNEIDKMVYELYRLSEEEIKVVESYGK